MVYLFYVNCHAINDWAFISWELSCELSICLHHVNMKNLAIVKNLDKMGYS